MEKLVIEGGNPLHGTIRVSGSKNAALPILLASLLCSETVTLTNVPNLRDITTSFKLLELLGCKIERAEGTAKITPVTLQPEAPYELVKTMRASVLCLGPLLARLGQADVALPGGCAIGARPVDLHLKALERMGAEFSLDSGYIRGRCGKLQGAKISFEFPTVGGTENLLMAASLAKGTTVLENAAREPEIVDLAKFLIAMGAKISGHGTSVITIEGVEKLHACEYKIMPDRIEAGTFIIAAAMTDGELLVEDCPTESLEGLLVVLQEMGVYTEEKETGLLVRRATNLLYATDITTQPFPGFPTDMQAQVMSLMCCATGAGSIDEKIFENRFMHVQELVRLGADIKLKGSTAIIRGVTHLTGAPVMASDLRASASLILAGLVAHGETEVERIYHLDRGYEAIEKKLSAVGAKIARVSS